jgi:DNA-binding MarR family transcriptional regulator
VIRAALSTRLDAEGGCSLLEHDLMSWLDVDGASRPRMLDLAGLLGITQSGITRLVDRLTARGWVEREQPPGNRRVMYARLTDQGRAVLATTRRAYFGALREELTARLSDAEIITLTGLTAGFLDQERHPTGGQAQAAGPGLDVEDRQTPGGEGGRPDQLEGQVPPQEVRPSESATAN